MEDTTKLIHGDCLEVLRTLPDCSVDAVVTDPPYGLAFMGKKWDYDVPSEDVWRECLRVLKPGGHLLAFAGTRTQHRMAVRIEDAGFEIRDMIAWVYGSGFPKSLDVSKAIDKMDAKTEQEARRYRFTAWVRSTGVTAKQIDEATGTMMGNHYTTHRSQPAIMTREHLEACRHLLGDIPAWVEKECDIRSVESRNMAKREVVGKDGRSANESWLGTAKRGETGFGIGEWDITAPATDAAKQWQGWGTALKPAMEPITAARKPLCGTVAENVLAHGTGAINVDGCRVGFVDDSDKASAKPQGRATSHGAGSLAGPGSAQDAERREFQSEQGNGRWPANLIHDGSDEVVGLFPVTTSGKPSGTRNANSNMFASGGKGVELTGFGDSGSAARFFYCAKASKADRGADNRHPTVKPTDLMRYLCRLVTPPGGTVLDPFMGSGSTGKAAKLEGFKFIGIEREAEYVTIATARLEAVA